MASKNLKLEAMRLENAKRAIKKLKQKRREDSRAEPSIPKEAVTGPVRKKLSSCKASTSKSVDAEQDLPHDTKVVERRKSRDTHIKSATSVSQQDTVLMDVGCGAPKLEVNAYVQSEWKSPALLPLPQVTETYSRKPQQLFKDLGCGSPKFELNAYVQPEWKSPTLLSLPEITKTYSKKPHTNDREITAMNLDTVMSRPSKKVKMIKKKKSLKVKRKMVRKLKRPRAPMSVTMQSASTSCPVFSASPENVTNETESETESLLNTQVSGVKRLNKCPAEAFSITTISENTLPTSDGSGLEDDCHEVEEEHDLPNTASNDDFETCEVVSKADKQPMNDPSKVQFHFIDGNVILHLKHPASFVFCGQLQLEVLKGTVEILGCQLNSSQGPQTIFSPRGFSLLSLETILSDKTHDLCNVDLDSSLMMSLLQEGGAGDTFILMKKVESTLPFFLEQYVPTKLFPQVNSNETEDPFRKAGMKLQCICNPTQGCKIFQKGDLWDEVSDHVIHQEPGCTVLCGGKGVGKSTMLRFLVNRLLSSGKEEILLIDLDPGQCEMTVPGCLSLSVIRKPLLGPNFTHLQNPEKCVYIGDVNVSNCVSRYMDACVSLVNYWQSEPKFKAMPCLINTMGFNKGLGITLMVQILSVMQPTSVIQILSKSTKRNYPELMSVDYVKRNCSNSPFRLKLDIQTLTQGRRLSCTSNINYELHVVNSASESQTDQHHQVLGIESKASREIAILSYLSQIVMPPLFSLLYTVPISCPLEFLYLSVCHESVSPHNILSVFNANFVALCCVDPKKEDVVKSSVPGLPSIITTLPTADCLGFGIVRGIDTESKQLYLLTPASPTTLISVNCLVVGAVGLPASVLLTPPKEPGPVPYVTECESQHTARPLKRSFRFSRFAANP